MEQPKIIVTGSNGQLGMEFQSLAEKFTQYTFYFFTKTELDITNKKNLLDKIEKINPDIFINCAAYTAVDKAEEEPNLAYLINEVAVGFIAEICFLKKIKFIHISTDYVFDGTSLKPYSETDKINPIGIYGLSKLKGEILAKEKNPDVLIIRTSWVYSIYNKNFVKTMLHLFKSQAELNVVNDQFGSPTSAFDLAMAILKIIDIYIINKTWHNGIFHYCNEGVINWYQFANEIKKETNSNIKINPIPTSLFPTRAKRPAFSALNTSKIKNLFNLEIPNWQISLQNMLIQFIN